MVQPIGIDRPSRFDEQMNRYSTATRSYLDGVASFRLVLIQTLSVWMLTVVAIFARFGFAASWVLSFEWGLAALFYRLSVF